MSNPLKKLTEHNDVFADVMNGLMFQGKRVIDPEDLMEVDEETPGYYNTSFEKNDMICKYWTKGGIILRLGGFDEALEQMQSMLRNAQKQEVNQKVQQNHEMERYN